MGREVARSRTTAVATWKAHRDYRQRLGAHRVSQSSNGRIPASDPSWTARFPSVASPSFVGLGSSIPGGSSASAYEVQRFRKSAFAMAPATSPANRASGCSGHAGSNQCPKCVMSMMKRNPGVAPTAVARPLLIQGRTPIGSGPRCPCCERRQLNARCGIVALFTVTPSAALRQALPRQ